MLNVSFSIFTVRSVPGPQWRWRDSVVVDPSGGGRGILGSLLLCWLPAIHAEPESLLADWLFTLTALLSWHLTRQY